MACSAAVESTPPRHPLRGRCSGGSRAFCAAGQNNRAWPRSSRRTAGRAFDSGLFSASQNRRHHVRRRPRRGARRRSPRETRGLCGAGRLLSGAFSHRQRWLSSRVAGAQRWLPATHVFRTPGGEGHPTAGDRRAAESGSAGHRLYHSQRWFLRRRAQQLLPFAARHCSPSDGLSQPRSRPGSICRAATPAPGRPLSRPLPAPHPGLTYRGHRPSCWYGDRPRRTPRRTPT